MNRKTEQDRARKSVESKNCLRACMNGHKFFMKSRLLMADWCQENWDDFRYLLLNLLSEIEKLCPNEKHCDFLYVRYTEHDWTPLSREQCYDLIARDTAWVLDMLEP